MIETMRALLVVVAVGGLCAGCGGDEPTDGPAGAPTISGSKDAQAKAVVERLFALVEAKKPAEMAALIAYRGKDTKRRWTDSSNYENQDEQKHVDRVFHRIERLQGMGAASFGTFESETESEGEWLVWHVTFGEGDKAKKVAFACINNGGTTLLGDID